MPKKNSADHDQTDLSEQSDQGLHYLPKSQQIYNSPC